MREFLELKNMDEVERLIQEEPNTFLYISKQNCSVCHSLKPQVQQVMEKFPKIKLAHVDSDEVKEVAGRFSIFTVPVLLLFIEGKEYLREARIVQMQLFEEKLEKIYEGMVE